MPEIPPSEKNPSNMGTLNRFFEVAAIASTTHEDNLTVTRPNAFKETLTLDEESRIAEIQRETAIRLAKQVRQLMLGQIDHPTPLNQADIEEWRKGKIAPLMVGTPTSIESTELPQDITESDFQIIDDLANLIDESDFLSLITASVTKASSTIISELSPAVHNYQKKIAASLENVDKLYIRLNDLESHQQAVQEFSSSFEGWNIDKKFFAFVLGSAINEELKSLFVSITEPNSHNTLSKPNEIREDLAYYTEKLKVIESGTSKIKLPIQDRQKLRKIIEDGFPSAQATHNLRYRWIQIFLTDIKNQYKEIKQKKDEETRLKHEQEKQEQALQSQKLLEQKKEEITAERELTRSTNPVYVAFQDKGVWSQSSSDGKSPIKLPYQPSEVPQTILDAGPQKIGGESIARLLTVDTYDKDQQQSREKSFYWKVSNEVERASNFLKLKKLLTDETSLLANSEHIFNRKFNSIDEMHIFFISDLNANLVGPLKVFLEGKNDENFNPTLELKPYFTQHMNELSRNRVFKLYQLFQDEEFKQIHSQPEGATRIQEIIESTDPEQDFQTVEEVLKNKNLFLYKVEPMLVRLPKEIQRDLLNFTIQKIFGRLLNSKLNTDYFSGKLDELKSKITISSEEHNTIVREVAQQIQSDYQKTKTFFGDHHTAQTLVTIARTNSEQLENSNQGLAEVHIMQEPMKADMENTWSTIDPFFSTFEGMATLKRSTLNDLLSSPDPRLQKAGQFIRQMLPELYSFYDCYERMVLCGVVPDLNILKIGQGTLMRTLDAVRGELFSLNSGLSSDSRMVAFDFGLPMLDIGLSQQSLERLNENILKIRNEGVDVVIWSQQGEQTVPHLTQEYKQLLSNELQQSKKLQTEADETSRNERVQNMVQEVEIYLQQRVKNESKNETGLYSDLDAFRRMVGIPDKFSDRRLKLDEMLKTT